MYNFLMIYGALIASFMPFMSIVPDAGGGASDDKTGNGVDGKKTSDPKQEFRQLAGELKELVSQQQAKSESEYQEHFEKLTKRFDDLEFDYDQYKKSAIIDDQKKQKYQHVETFSNAFYKFAKGDRYNLESEVKSGALEVKSGYHPSIKDTKSDNIVRFDQATGGALLMPGEVSLDIIHNAVEFSAVARLVNRTVTSLPSKTRTLRVGTPGIQWIEEEGKVAKKKMTYRTVTLTPKKAAARYGTTIENEQDTGVDLLSEINRAYQEDFEVGVGTAILSGDGIAKPTGLLAGLTEFESAALALSTDDLINIQEQLLDQYQNNADWLFTRETRANVRARVLSSTNGLQYTWEPDFTRKSPTLLLGSPVNIARKGDLPGKVSGNFTSGQTPIVYGDFSKGYELVMRSDMYMIDDPYSESDSFVRNFNIMSRVDGKPMLTEGLVKLKMTA